MKYHRKARQFCKTVIFKEKGAKERLWSAVKNRIESADSAKIPLKKLMEKFGEEFGDKKPEEAIGFLEVLYESLGTRSIQAYLYGSENFCFDWRKTNRRGLFDIVFNSMVKTAKERNNEDLLKQLNTYTELITNHIKAKELYESEDPNEEYCFFYVKQIRKTLTRGLEYPLIQKLDSIGCALIHNVPEMAIVYLEALYEALIYEKDFIEQHQLNRDEYGELLSIDALFSQAFYALYEAAEGKPISDDEILDALKKYYPEF